jgi:two-component system, OmpR family, sensor histidine kinase KdpD
VTSRGELRIYLGPAPGAGKTFAMLSEAHRRRERGTDVVVGVVHARGRDRTAQLLHGLDAVPPRRPGAGLEPEPDIERVLARRPDVVLVDDLAHMNGPGARNPTRWEDVEELRAAGITVLATLDVEHLASLSDVVEQIVGTRPAETVPDEFVRAAEQVELVDITPEALRRRFAHGNVYSADEVDAAVAGYFDPATLTALRELALLWVADHTHLALQRHRRERPGAESWETRERIVVALSGGAESPAVLRRAARLARRGGSIQLLAVHVLHPQGVTGPPVDALAGLRRLADDVGASLHTVVGDDVAHALLDFARGAHATQLVLGTSHRSHRIRPFERGTALRVIRGSGSIDVHVVHHADTGRGVSVPRRHTALSPSRKATGWTAGIVLPGIATAVGVLGRGVLDLPTNVMLVILAIVVVALIGGLGPALLAAIAGAAMLNFFFTDPLYTLTIADRANIITLIAGVVVAIIVALLVDRAARRSQQAARAGSEAALLASISHTVLAETDPLPRLLAQVREVFSLASVTLLERTSAGWQAIGSAGSNHCSNPEEADADVAVEPDVHLVGSGRVLPAADRRLFETVAGQALLAVRNQRIAADAEEARRRAEATELRTALLSAVGHDLRTPLTSIKAAVGSLRDPHLRLPPADTAELQATIEESADRLTGLIDNLLDSSRLATGTVTPLLGPTNYNEVVARALAASPPSAPITVDIDEYLPDVLADVGLLERVVANVIDNAVRHGGGTLVAISAGTHADRVELRIADRGPGVAPGHRDRLFAPFQRAGDRNTTTGVGLGLSVARGFTDAMGGSITADDTPGGGLTIAVALPKAAPAPMEVGP